MQQLSLHIESKQSRVNDIDSIYSKLEDNLNISNRESLSHYVNFQTASDNPIQRWFPYREGFSFRLVQSFIKEFNVNQTVFDPFCGSGSTLLASRLCQVNSIGIDINPLSVLIAQVENAYYDDKDIEEFKNYISELKVQNQSNSNYKCNFHLASKIFNNDILRALLQIKEIIINQKNVKIKNLLFIAWLSIIEKVSNIKKEGNGIKYKNRRRTNKGYISIDRREWENKHFPDDKFSYVKNILLSKLKIILHDLIYEYGSTSVLPKIIQNNSLYIDRILNTEVQFTFFSPPYCNCFDYFEIHKVELWMGDFVNDKKEINNYRSSSFRSNTNSIINKKVNYYNNMVEKLINSMDILTLWNKNIPLVIRGYFDDMYQFLKSIYLKTINNGYVGIVVGNSAYSNIIIPTDLIIANIAQEIGFKVDKVFIIRHLTTSAQQMKHLTNSKKYLRESIIWLRK